VRDWDEYLPELEGFGAELLVLSSDSLALLRRIVPDKGLLSQFASVDPWQWHVWGLANPRRPLLPNPATVGIAPNGTVVFLEIHADYKKRSTPSEVIAALVAHRESGVVAAPAPGPVDVEIDWNAALTVTASKQGRDAQITMTIARGFHVYGTKEENARPLAVRV
jgi:hypothetical protein